MKSEQGIFFGYSQNSRAYRVFIKKFGTVMETINAVVNDFESVAIRINDEDDETLNIPVDTFTLPKEVPKVDTLPYGTDINSEKRSKEVIANNPELGSICTCEKESSTKFYNR